ncbi:hypothetical protein DRO02_03880 [archaeon]|nr:MAG: hypothetical protein DRO02_03880 [archaeon]
MGRVGITFTLMFLLMLRSMTVFCDPRGLSNIENMIAEFSDAIKNFLDILMEKAIEVGEVLAVTSIVVGFVLYGTHLFAYHGRRLIMSGLVLWIFLQLVR